jgi:hypothetical protein
MIRKNTGERGGGADIVERLYKIKVTRFPDEFSIEVSPVLF